MTTKGAQPIYLLEARHFLHDEEESERKWFVWSFAAHSDRNIIAEHARFSRKHWTAYDFRVAKYIQVKP